MTITNIAVVLNEVLEQMQDANDSREGFLQEAVDWLLGEKKYKGLDERQIRTYVVNQMTRLDHGLTRTDVEAKFRPLFKEHYDRLRNIWTTQAANAMGIEQEREFHPELRLR